MRSKDARGSHKNSLEVFNMENLGTDGANHIKKHEGFSLKFYGDPYGYPTVGWGFDNRH